PSAAKRIFFLADHLDAAEALRIGLVNRVVPKAELDDAVAEWTDRIAHNAPLTIAAAKAAVRQWSLPD
ncbi:MAG TPA: enoyl-CoA hydratase, partial [Acidimicrobiaceae bacterium]|nr:enoyl-CoA hydratase [Acidimicrobiaceae bacterium]